MYHKIPLFIEGSYQGTVPLIDEWGGKIAHVLNHLGDFDCHAFVQYLNPGIPFGEALLKGEKDVVSNSYTAVTSKNIVKGDFVLFTTSGFGLKGSHSALCIGSMDSSPLLLSKSGPGKLYVTDMATILLGYKHLEGGGKYKLKKI